MRIVVTADQLWDGTRTIHQPFVLIDEGLIVSVASRTAHPLPPADCILQLDGSTLSPAFFDVHIHGAAGHDVMEATPEALDAIGSFLALHGTGSYLATTVTASVDETLRSLSGLGKLIAQYSVNSSAPDAIARPIGIHLEGPFLSHIKRGVHPVEHLLDPDIALFDRMFEAAEGNICLITLAPELVGAVEFSKYVTARGVRVSMGHSNANAAEAHAAIDAGAVSATHTFNAMRALDHREPGILGVTLATDSLFAELICDGVHVNPEIVRLWWRAKGPQRGLLVTDAMSATGMPDGTYQLGGFDVEVAHGRATVGGVLAGSVLTLDHALENFIAFTGAPLDEALRLLTTNPATMIGLVDRVGGLVPGQPANLIAVDKSGKRLMSMQNGIQID